MGKATNDGFRELQRSAGRAARLLKLLANEKRLLLLCQLVGRELPVGELARRVGLSPSALSQHLGKLKADRLVAARRRSQSIYYRLKDGTATRILTVLYDIYCPNPDKRGAQL